MILSYYMFSFFFTLTYFMFYFIENYGDILGKRNTIDYVTLVIILLLLSILGFIITPLIIIYTLLNLIKNI